MISLNNHTAWVTVDGVEAQEYDVQVDKEKKTVTCWIASEAGKTYEVSCKGTNIITATDISLVIDGRKCGGKYIKPKSSRSSTTRKFRGLRTSPTTIHPSRFSPVETTDDYDATSLDNPELGNISLVVRWTRLIGKTTYEASASTLPEERKYHETAKKGFNHQTSFSHSEQTKFLAEQMITQPYGEPLVTFLFKYRPLGILQANGIAPRPAPQHPSSTSPSTSQRSSSKRPAPADEEDVKPDIVEDEDDRRLQELQREMDAIRAKKQAARCLTAQEGQDGISEPIQPFNGITIDLTLDDD
ncbi:hypothetical protein VNI00_013622 [Paramarasmius palmivorus]|uniref:DUF7918 domain-containing protein n=1 Tax=Paramarasmius palmivorus TaxID=297713 RepID=A0AAW0BXX0_9AGAR